MKGFQLKRLLPLLPTIVTICWSVRTVGAQGTAIPLSEVDIQDIVDAHNFFRGMVQPSASNMQRIVR